MILIIFDLDNNPFTTNKKSQILHSPGITASLSKVTNSDPHQHEEILPHFASLYPNTEFNLYYFALIIFHVVARSPSLERSFGSSSQFSLVISILNNLVSFASVSTSPLMTRTSMFRGSAPRTPGAVRDNNRESL